MVCFCIIFSSTLYGQIDNQTLPEWFADFDSQDVHVRRTAAVKLNSWKSVADPRVIERMSKLLFEERDAQVRLTILEAAIGLGSSAQPLVPALVESLKKEVGGRKNEELHQDHREALALASIGPAALDGLRELLACPRVNVRAEAAMGLAKIGPPAISATRELLSLLDDKDERVREEATSALAAFGDSVRTDLLAAFAQSTPLAQSGIVRALAKIPIIDEKIAAIIFGSVVSEDIDLRIAALDVLESCRINSGQCQSILLSNLRHSDKSVRRAVIRQLSDHFQQFLPEMKGDFLQLISNGESGVAHDAAYLVARLGTDGAEALIDTLRHPNCDVEAVADALGSMGSSVFEILAQSMSSRESSVRRGCASALGQIRPLPEKAMQVLLAGLQDEEPAVQLACLDAVGRLQSKARQASPTVQKLLTHSNATIRASANRVLFELGPRNAELVGHLQIALNDASNDVQLIALDSLRSMGPVAKPALPAVIEKLTSTHRPIQLSALAMIASHGRAVDTAMPKIVELLQVESNPDLTLAVLQTLAQFGNEAAPALERVKQLLSVMDVRVRLAAIDVISGIDLPIEQAKIVLTPLFADSDQEIRKRSLRAVRKYGSEGVIFVADLIAQVTVDEKKDSYLLREIQRLEKFDVAEAAIAPLLELLDHSNPKVLGLACEFLGRVSPPRSDIVERLAAARGKMNNSKSENGANE